MFREAVYYVHRQTAADKSGTAGTMVTIKDVAQKAGVPVRMAARALSGTTLGKRRDARERAERIRQAAKELGYCPSEIAVSLTRGRTRTLGLLLPSLTDMFYAAASEIAMDEAAREGYSVLIRLTRFRPELAAENIERFRASRVDGILFGDDCGGIPEELLELLRRETFPFLTFAHSNGNGFSSVTPDHRAAIRAAVEALAARGHARLAFALFRKNYHSNRIDAIHFQEACSACGVDGELCWQEQIGEYAGLAARRYDALLINGKYSMRAFLDSIPDPSGYHPDLIGFYNEWTWAQASSERLRGTVMDQAERIVRTAVQALIGQIADREVRQETIPSCYLSKEDFSTFRVCDLTSHYLDTAVPSAAPVTVPAVCPPM